MELKEEFIELRQKYADLKVYRGCTDGSEELAYCVYKSALESFKKKIESKKWKLTLIDSIVEGTGMNNVLKAIMYLDVNEIVSFELEEWSVKNLRYKDIVELFGDENFRSVLTNEFDINEKENTFVASEDDDYLSFSCISRIWREDDKGNYILIYSHVYGKEE